MATDDRSYRWKKFNKGIGSVAIVTLDVSESTSGQNEIVEHYSGIGFTGQGNIEEVPLHGYNSWKIAARQGLEYAFSLVDGFWKVDLFKIEGRAFIDTNPTVVGYTVLRAFLDRIGFQLDASQIDQMEEFVLASWSKSSKELIPNFFNLTVTEFKK